MHLAGRTNPDRDVHRVMVAGGNSRLSLPFCIQQLLFDALFNGESPDFCARGKQCRQGQQPRCLIVAAQLIE